jgi:hypothetical protein
MRRRKACNVAAHSPCDRAFYRRIPALFRRGAPRGGSNVVQDQNLYALANFSAANYLQTAMLGGETGAPAPGFGAVMLFYVSALPTTQQIIFHNLDSGATVGWYWQLSTTSLRFCGQATTAYTITASDVGKLLVAHAVYTGSAFRIVVNRVQIGVDTSAGITVGTQRTQLGQWNATQLFTNGGVLATMTHRGAPSVAQMQAYSDSARALGDLPASIDGATVAHRWSVKEELRGADNPIGRKSYGLRTFTAANYVQTATGIGATAGAFWIEALWRPDTRVTDDFDFLVAKLNDTAKQGYQLYLSGVTTMTWLLYNTSAATYGVTWGWPVELLGQMVHLVGNYTGSNLELYANGVLVATVAAPIAYAPYTAGPMRCGVRASDNLGPVTNGSLFGFGGGTGQSLTAAEVAARFTAVEKAGLLATGAPKTTALWDFTTPIAANAGAAPATFPDTVGTDNMTRTGTLEVAVQVAKAPPCPAQLTDRVTAAAGDALARVGTPSVVKIDPTIDGRRTLGAQGISAVNRLITAANAGLRGSATMWGHWYGRLDALATALELLASCTPGGNDGWQVYLGTSGALSFTIRNGANTTTVAATSANSTIVAADIGRPQQVQWTYDGTTLNLYFKRVLVATATSSGYTAPISSVISMIVGGRTDGAIPGSSESFFALQGGDGAVPTLAELQAAYDATEATGRIQAIPGKTQHQWDLSVDVLASGVDAVPAVVLDRVGADNLSRVGPDYAISGKQGLRLTGSVQGLSTAPGGGIQGAASAVTICLLFSPLTGVGTALEVLAGKYTNPAGWDFRRQPNTGSLNIGFGNATGQVSSPSGYTIVGGDIGSLLHAAITYDGANVRFYVQGVLIGTTALTGAFVPSTGPMTIGNRADGFPSNNDNVFYGIAGGAYVATQAELATQAAASIAAGQLVAIPGKTDDRRYSFAQDAVDQATPLPAYCVDRTGTSPADRLARIGSGLTLAQRTERLFSYETSPILTGAKTFSATDYFSHATAYRGSAASFHFKLLFRIDSQAVTSAARFLASNINDSPSNSGFGIYTTGTNSLIAFTAANGAGTFVSAPTYPVLAGDVGKLLLAHFVWDGAKLRTYIKRIEVSTGTAVTGFIAATTQPMMIGRDPRSAAPSPADAGLTIYGWGYGGSAPTLAEVQADHDAVLAYEDAVLSSRLESLISLKRSINLNGGTLPTTLNDQLGALNFTKTGSPVVAPYYARAAGW